MTKVLEIKNLEKSFSGRAVVKGLDLSVPEHAVFGFIGPNGAGKTTTMKMVLGLLRPDQGSITVCGERVSYGETKTNRFVGYLPDVPEFYGYLTPLEYLSLCGHITGMKKARIKQRSEELLRVVGLENTKQRIAGFSRGMKQRLGIAQAMINEPRLLICDEPTSALDPAGRKEILDILSEIRGKTTVLFSTHVLSDVERICDQIAVIKEGSIVLQGTLESIKAQRMRDEYRIELHDADELQQLRSALAAAAPHVKVIVEGLEITIQEGNGGELISLLNNLALVPLKFERVEPNLEDLFLEAVK